MHAKQALSILSLALTLVAAAPAFAQDAADQKSLPTQLIDALNAVFGKQTDNRAVHAKGIVLEGKFTPSADAASLSKAPHLQAGATVPVTVRFSDFAGVPAIPDTDPNASPRGMAVKFHLPDGSNSDLVMHSYNGFPTATAAEFRDLLLALAASGKDAPKPTPLETFFGTHPIAKTFLTAEKPAPVSFATLPYFGVNSFKFTNAKGDSTVVRYQMLPEGSAEYLTKEQLAEAGPNYLAEEIRKRVGDGPVRMACAPTSFARVSSRRRSSRSRSPSRRRNSASARSAWSRRSCWPRRWTRNSPRSMTSPTWLCSSPPSRPMRSPASRSA